MSKIILDCGSGNTCKNDAKYVERMISEINAVNTKKHTIIFKWQLFNPETSPHNVALDPGIFLHAYTFAKRLGYKTTASVFDEKSVKFLLTFDIPFVKLACNPEVYPLIGMIPRGIKIIISTPDIQTFSKYQYLYNFQSLCCVTEYPASVEQYITRFTGYLSRGISDHTPDLSLFKTYQPGYYERHLKLSDSTGNDAGIFASTPEQLKEIL